MRLVLTAKNSFENGPQKSNRKKICCANIATIALYIESKGMISTAEKFVDNVYDYFIKLADDKMSYAVCREPSRASIGYKCVTYKKKYIVVFFESVSEITIH